MTTYVNKSYYQMLKPLKFEGGPDPLLYAEWLRKMQNLFAMMKCPKCFKVQLGTINLKRRQNIGGKWLNPVKESKS